jgi:hypothetical protein
MNILSRTYLKWRKAGLEGVAREQWSIMQYHRKAAIWYEAGVGAESKASFAYHNAEAQLAHKRAEVASAEAIGIAVRLNRPSFFFGRRAGTKVSNSQGARP